MATSTITIRHYKSNKSNRSIVKHNEITTPSFRKSFKSTMNIVHITSNINYENDESNLSSCSILNELCNLTNEKKEKKEKQFNQNNNFRKSQFNQKSNQDNNANQLNQVKIVKPRVVKSSSDLHTVKTVCGSISTNDNSNLNINYNNSDSLSIPKKDSLTHIQNNWAMGILETINDKAVDKEIYIDMRKGVEKRNSFWGKLFSIDSFRCGI